MKRTISAMVGKGSVNHNSRKFKAANVDGERTCQNIDYCNEDIKAVYHELFDDALERYNAKQTRDDRRIEDYYEKIRSGKQGKPFHELILQIGDKDNMSATTENGELPRRFWTSIIKAFRSGTRACEFSRLTCIWTRLPRIYILTSYRSRPGVIEVWIREFR